MRLPYPTNNNDECNSSANPPEDAPFADDLVQERRSFFSAGVVRHVGVL